MSRSDQANDAWQEFKAEHPEAEQHWVFMFAYRRALEDAADAVKRVRESDTYTPGYPEHPQFEKWLRDLAAGVGTKDGDEDYDDMSDQMRGLT